MSKALLPILICLSVLSLCCHHASSPAQPVVICIQPFKDIKDNQVDYIYKRLQAVYPHVRKEKRIDLPSTAFYAPRNRYRADSLIRFLRDRTAGGYISIGLTSSDISHTKGKTGDFGIMGLGYQPGKSCVVSTFRLSSDSLLPQYFKLALHELGHTQGLPHCQEETCFMRDAEGKNHFNEQTGFCERCKAILIPKGWKL